MSIDEIIAGMTEAQKRALLAMPKTLGTYATCSEMRPATNGSALDSLYMRYGSWLERQNRCAHILCSRRWTKWGGEPGQKRGEGYEYTPTPLGLAVRARLEEQHAE